MKPEAKPIQQVTPATMLSNSLAQLNRRMRLVEERVDNIREHIELVESNLIEKNKENVKDFAALSEEMRQLRMSIKENTTLFQRMVDKLESFASKENVKVLERYINLWSPLEYVTRQEVEDIIAEKLGSAKSGDED